MRKLLSFSVTCMVLIAWGLQTHELRKARAAALIAARQYHFCSLAHNDAYEEIDRLEREIAARRDVFDALEGKP